VEVVIRDFYLTSKIFGLTVLACLASGITEGTIKLGTGSSTSSHGHSKKRKVTRYI